VDFTVVDALAEHRDAARRWVAEHLPELDDWVEEQRVTGNYLSLECHRRLADAGWLGAGWPEEYGGSTNDVDLAAAIEQEIRGAGLQIAGWRTTTFIINTIRDIGTEEQKREIVAGALRGEVVIALGYTEPDSGSDVAAAKTRAERDGDEWVINGQKMFTTHANFATHVFMLTRTNPDVPKHKGLTTFLVRLDAPGIEVQPVHTIGGERSNATFYTDVRTPDRYRVGEVDGGWSVMHTALVYERAAGGGAGTFGSGPTLAQRVADWARHTRRDDGSLVWDDASVRERLARIAIEEEVTRMLLLNAGWAAQQGDMSGVPGAAAKLFGKVKAQQHDSDLLDILGADAVLHREAGDAPLRAAVEETFRADVVKTVYGGSSEIMREIIAERKLGLPKARPNR
jgi:alkylation response protein AidB-like acyl-CoA dehydrogenase